MCGRFSQAATVKELMAEFAFRLSGIQAPFRYNIAPSQLVLSIRQENTSNDPELVYMEWGLIPEWVSDRQRAKALINARAETAAVKPAFRGPVRYRRCIIPATGFYEWKRKGSSRQPYYIHPAQGATVFGLAGIYEVYEGGEGSYLETCSILTTAPNELMTKIHDRMPVILPSSGYERWLDPRVQKPQEIVDLLVSYPAELMSVRPVSALVNSVQNEGSDLIMEEKDFPLHIPTQTELF